MAIEDQDGVKISDMPDLSSITGKEYFPVVDSAGTNRKVATSLLATKTELEGKVDNSEIADMLTKTEAASTYQPKGDYLTAVPDEYVTETELKNKGYATTTQLSDAVADKLTKTQADEYYQATGDYALKSEIPDVSGFITSSQADGKYATLEQIGNIDAILDSINGEVI